MADVNEEPLRSIIANVERLLRDAHVLLSNGSPGSAMSIAILAFEETGKGHVFELDLSKTKRTPSWHHFRQITSAFALTASLFQKYDFTAPNIPENIRDLIEERWKDTKTLSEVASKPIPEELREKVAKIVAPGLEHLDEDQRRIFGIEMRWVGKIVAAAAEGLIEQKRQNGIYLDFKDGNVESSPLNIDRTEALRWIRISERALLILKYGAYREPYGELAAMLESMPRPLPSEDALIRMLNDIEASAISR